MEEKVNQDHSSRGERTRHDLIEAACDLFILNGFHATTTRQITDKLGMVAGAIYNHFDSKTSLFEAVLYTYHPWLKIPEVLSTATGSTMEEYLRDTTNKLLAEWDKRPELIRLHLIEILEFNGKHIPALFEEVFTKVSQIINENQVGKEINVTLLYRAVLGLFFGYLMSDKAIINSESGLKEKRFIDENFDYFADAYLYGLLSQNMDDSNKGKDKQEN